MRAAAASSRMTHHRVLPPSTTSSSSSSNARSLPAMNAQPAASAHCNLQHPPARILPVSSSPSASSGRRLVASGTTVTQPSTASCSLALQAQLQRRALPLQHRMVARQSSKRSGVDDDSNSRRSTSSSSASVLQPISLLAAHRCPSLPQCSSLDCSHRSATVAAAAVAAVRAVEGSLRRQPRIPSGPAGRAGHRERHCRWQRKGVMHL